MLLTAGTPQPQHLASAQQSPLQLCSNDVKPEQGEKSPHTNELETFIKSRQLPKSLRPLPGPDTMDPSTRRAPLKRTWHTLPNFKQKRVKKKKKKMNMSHAGRSTTWRDGGSDRVVCLPPFITPSPTPHRSALSVLSPLFHRRWLPREVMFPAMRHSVKLINKKTANVSSAPKIATAKRAYRGSCRSEGGYKLRWCSLWIPNTPPTPFYLSLYLSQSFLPRPVRYMISFVCLHLHPPLPPLSYCLNYYHYSTAASKPSCWQDRVEARARRPCRAASSRFNISPRWRLTYSDLFKMIREGCGAIPMQITLWPHKRAQRQW